LISVHCCVLGIWRLSRRTTFRRWLWPVLALAYRRDETCRAGWPGMPSKLPPTSLHLPVPRS